MRLVTISCAAVLCVLLASPASAQNPRSFVASAGLDSNDCTRPAPCRTFNKAISVSVAGAEIVALDSAGYGPITVDRSIQIVAPEGVHAAITATTGNAITLNTIASDVVAIRGLYLSGAGATNGISLTGTVGKLFIENCVISGFSTSGISAVFTSGPSQMDVRNTQLRNNGTGLTAFASPSVTARLTIDRVTASMNSTGIRITQLPADVRNSVMSGNATAGLVADTAKAVVAMDSCSVFGNGDGLYSNGAAMIRVSNTIITTNTLGLHIGSLGSEIISRANAAADGDLTNTVEGNTTNGAFTGHFAGK